MVANQHPVAHGWASLQVAVHAVALCAHGLKRPGHCKHVVSKRCVSGQTGVVSEKVAISGSKGSRRPQETDT